MKNWFRPLAVVAVASMALSACSLFEDDEEQIIVAELVEFEPQFEGEELWSASVGDGVDEHASRLRPAVAYGKVFAASREGIIKALDKESGDTLWEVNVGEKDNDRWFGGYRTAMVSGGMVAAYNKVYFGTERGFVFSLDAETGEEIWRVTVAGEVLAPPVAAEGKLVVNTLSGKIYGLDAETGEEIWNFEGAVPPLTLRGSGTPAVDNGAAFFGTSDGKLSAVFLERGFQIWEEQLTQPSGSNDLERMVDVDADILTAGDKVYAVAYNGDLIAAEMRSGREIWKRPYSSYQGMVMDGFQLYLSSSSSYVFAIDRRDATELWANREMENRQITTPAFVGRYVVVGDFEGYLHWLDGNTGQFVARMNVDSDGFYSNPVVDGDVIYIQARGGYVYAIKTP
ncbi:outer membrane protein assembly factor BamB [Neiella marina]|uniref:Outer membrane protein assembly factor BamB n=1 Tax=Neiella holothuriorum TaxID=2870530 RepID=A0ABS7EEV2_9GAMM|nr:outer membrane protein assembly factor BamB [Neiella holothuriorum]MBW8190861.1 outer membrane protein assembly factor BamB [Neiella holothuriorum]